MQQKVAFCSFCSLFELELIISEKFLRQSVAEIRRDLLEMKCSPAPMALGQLGAVVGFVVVALAVMLQGGVVLCLVDMHEFSTHTVTV